MINKAVSVKDISYPKVHQKETQIQELERQLKFIIQKEESLIVQKEALLRLPPDTASTKQQWEEFRVQVVANKHERDLTTDRLTLFREDLPQLLDQAEKAEVDLVGKKEEKEKIKSQITKMDKELAKLLKRPMALIKERQETIQLLQLADQEISSLTSLLRWHPPKPEVLPGEPEVLSKLKSLFPPTVVRWRGKAN